MVNNANQQHLPYLYKWTQKSTGKYYIGSRTAKGCHPGDGYKTSSKIVKPQIIAHPEDWSREVLVVGPVDYIRSLESNLLKELDAAGDPQSYNLSNNDPKFYGSLGNKVMSEAEKQNLRECFAGKTYVERFGEQKAQQIKEKISAAGRGRKMPPFSQEHRRKLGLARKGSTITPEHRKAISDANRGKVTSEATKEKIRKAHLTACPAQKVRAPDGTVYDSAVKASEAHNVTCAAIRYRIKKVPGWEYL